MNRAWLEIVFPASLLLLVCAICVLLLTAGGLLDPAPVPAAAPPVAAVDSAARPTPVARAVSAADAAAVAAGETLFKGNCAQCHAVNDVVVGPGLGGITERRPISWIIPWVKNSSKVVASGDDYAVRLFNQYGKQQMPSFQLSDQ